MAEVRTIAAEFGDFEGKALSVLPKDDRDLVRLGFYSGALAMLNLLAMTPSSEADIVVHAFRMELEAFRRDVLTKNS